MAVSWNRDWTGWKKSYDPMLKFLNLRLATTARAFPATTRHHRVCRPSGRMMVAMCLAQRPLCSSKSHPPSRQLISQWTSRIKYLSPHPCRQLMEETFSITRDCSNQTTTTIITTFTQYKLVRPPNFTAQRNRLFNRLPSTLPKLRLNCLRTMRSPPTIFYMPW